MEVIHITYNYINLTNGVEAIPMLKFWNEDYKFIRIQSTVCEQKLWDRYHLKIEISWDGVAVYLEYDPDKEFDEKCIIPIKYETLEEFAYIPNSEYREKYNPNDYGIDLKEITLIKEIMEYLESHSTEINELCNGYDWEYRKLDDEEKSV